MLKDWSYTKRFIQPESSFRYSLYIFVNENILLLLQSMRDVGKNERHEAADMPENRGKNRYVNVLPCE